MKQHNGGLVLIKMYFYAKPLVMKE